MSKCTVRVPYVTCNLKPASFSTDCDFLSVFSSCGSDLSFLTLKEKSWFYYWRFVEDYYIHLTPFSDEKLQLFCSGSYRSEFQDIVLVCLPFISGNIFLPVADDQKFQKCQMSREFCCSFTGSYTENHKFKAPVKLPVWNFGRLRVNRRHLWWPGSC